MAQTQTVTGTMQQSIKSLNAQMRAHRYELRENLAQLDSNRNSIEALRLKQNSYTKQLETQRQIVEQLTRNYKQLVQAHGEHSTKATRAAAAVAKARAEQAELEQRLKRTTDEIRRQSSALGRLRGDFAAARADAMPTNRFEAMRSVGFAMSGVGAAGTAALGGVVRVAADFEQAMSRVAALSGATDQQLQQLTDTAKRLGETTVFSATQAAEGMQFLSMAGFKTNDIIAAMPGVLDMAAAAQIDLGRAADIASNIMSAFGKEASEMTNVADVLTKAFTSANVDLEMLGYTMKYVGPVANAAGYSLEEMAAAAGLLGNAGIQAEQAGTSLRAILLRLSSPPKDAAEALEQLGVSVTDASGKMLPLADVLAQMQSGMNGLSEAQRTSIAATIAGTEAASALLALLDAGPDTLRTFTKELENAGGTAREIADKQLDNLAGSMTILQSAMEGAAISIGEVLSPYIRQAAEWLTGLIDRFNNLSPEMQRTIAILAALTAGFFAIGGPILLIIGSLPMVAAGFSMLLGPAGAVIAIFGLLVAAGVAVWQNWETIRTKTGEIWGAIVNTISGFLNSIMEEFTAFKDFVVNTWESIKSFLQNPISGTVELIQRTFGGGGANRHASGINYVPRDNYPALLHRGETVLSRAEADQYRQSGRRGNAGLVINININGYNRSTDEILSEMEDRLIKVAENMGLA